MSGPDWMLQTIRSLYNPNESRVHILSGTSSMSPPVDVGLCQGRASSSILFVILTDRVSSQSRGLERVQLGDLEIASVVFADGVALLASSGGDFQHARCRFETEREVATVICSKMVDRPFQLGSEMVSPRGRGEVSRRLFHSSG